MIFPRIKVILRFSLVLENFYCIEKEVLERNDEELLKMRQSKSVAQEMCIFYRFVNERHRCSTTFAFYGQESIFSFFDKNYTIIVITTYHEKFVHS